MKHFHREWWRKGAYYDRSVSDDSSYSGCWRIDSFGGCVGCEKNDQR